MRRAAEIPQAVVAEAVGVADNTVAGWELGSSEPDQEKLPALAKVLKHSLDHLFPRDGLPDLTDLRCDAGLYQYETAPVIQMKSAGPVAAAERGERRLKDRYVPLLAERYGVSTAELLRAQERSFAAAEEKKRGGGEPGLDQGSAAADLDRPPASLAEKITFILQRSYPGPEGPPSDAEMAADVNAQLGAEVLTEEDFEGLRTGAKETAPPGVLDALATVVGVSEMYFKSDEAVAAQVYEGLKLIAAHRQGLVGRIKARGLGSAGLPPNVMALVTELAQEMAEKEAETGK
ncbi:helix-turn-helix domain-containing protein [Streptomyces sp. NPDC008086]|uniref:helix-turn-helix domain-containing protein n=1 Tax=Streptomyces sp. NPDC008086 TaxID=3364807 RepID=UPI0036E0637B